MLSQVAEAIEIQRHFKSVFQGPEDPLPVLSHEAPQSFEHSDIVRALEQIPVTKATPQHYAPAFAGKQRLEAWRKSCMLASPPSFSSPHHRCLNLGKMVGWLCWASRPSVAGGREILGPFVYKILSARL